MPLSIPYGVAYPGRRDPVLAVSVLVFEVADARHRAVRISEFHASCGLLALTRTNHHLRAKAGAQMDTRKAWGDAAGDGRDGR